MKKYLKVGAVVLVAVHFLLAIWVLLHGDIRFHADIARDFLLLNELSEKGLVLIGPRSSINGLFHGPLWTYLNYPAYFIGQGNPLVVGWFWALLGLLFLVTGFKIAKRLFDEKTAYVYVVLQSLVLLGLLNETFHPYGALFLSPTFFYTFIRYAETLKQRYLTAHLLVAGLMIQFQMATGIPFLLLSSVYILYLIIRNRKPLHILSFAILAIPFSTFVLFDIRHGFTQYHSIIKFFAMSPKSSPGEIGKLLHNRLDFITTDGIYLFYGSSILTQVITPIFIGLVLRQIKNRVYTRNYWTFLYFFFGYFLLSIANKGVVLHPHFIALTPLIFMVFASLISIKPRAVFLFLAGGVYFFWLNRGLGYVQNRWALSGKDETSWKFQLEMAKSVYENSAKDFGYYIYSPDLYGYAPRYAMVYGNRVFGLKGSSFQKKATTYLIYSTIAADIPWYAWDADSRHWGTPTYWRTNKVRITNNNKVPSEEHTFANGYKWEKYLLNSEEITIPTDKDFDMGITFR